MMLRKYRYADMKSRTLLLYDFLVAMAWIADKVRGKDRGSVTL